MALFFDLPLFLMPGSFMFSILFIHYILYPSCLFVNAPIFKAYIIAGFTTIFKLSLLLCNNSSRLHPACTLFFTSVALRMIQFKAAQVYKLIQLYCIYSWLLHLLLSSCSFTCSLFSLEKKKSAFFNKIVQMLLKWLFLLSNVLCFSLCMFSLQVSPVSLCVKGLWMPRVVYWWQQVGLQAAKCLSCPWVPKVWQKDKLHISPICTHQIMI